MSNRAQQGGAGKGALALKRPVGLKPLAVA